MNRITWFADEIIATARPNQWQSIAEASQQLLRLIGNEEFAHEIILPQRCLPPLAEALQREKFSVIIDLTGGWLGESLKGVFPSTPIVKDFHISRVREVSNPELPTTGHVLNISRQETKALSRTLDMSAPLIIDDVSFSGFSSHVAMQHFGLQPEQTSHAFLVLNVGDLGPQPGAKHMLEATGSKVFGGQTINTSENEDGWHLKDLIDHGSLERTLGLVLPIQEFLEKRNGNAVRDLFETESLRKILFPNAVKREHLNALEASGLFIRHSNRVLDEQSIHTTNPLLLASPYFLKHVSSQKFREHFDEVSDILLWLRDSMGDSEAEYEAAAELRKECTRILQPFGKERI